MKEWTTIALHKKGAMSRTFKTLSAGIVLAAGVIHPAHAQDATFDGEYMKRLKMYETVQPHGDTPFGESINLYTGELGFNQTDVDYPGQGPSIVLAREYRAQFQYWSPINTLGDWNLSIPRIETFVRTPGRSNYPYGLGTPGENWKVETATAPDVGQPGITRCTNFSAPYDLAGAQPLWWQGFELITERGGRQQILRRDPSNTAKPQMTGANGQPMVFPAVTQDHWQIGCLPNTSNGQPGEAFLAVSPEGTKYYMDYLVGIRATNVLEDSPYAPKGIIFHPRMLATMYVSRIEDRFGNYVTYQYAGDKLTAIDASDGRHVAITWHSDANYHVIQSITTQPGTPLARTWTYEYNGRLTGVELPDHSKWQFNLPVSGALASSTDPCPPRNISPATNPATAVTGSVVHPSGLKGSFTLAGTYHGRSYVPSECRINPASQAYQEDIDPTFSTGSLIAKTISGPGVPLQQWNYEYSPVQASTTQDACAQNGTCPETRWVDVTGPGSDRKRYTLSTRWGALEGKALKTEVFAGASSLRMEMTEYNLTSSAYPSVGSTLQDWHSNSAKSEVWLPVKRKTIAQQGKLFTWQANAFDAFARPTSITRSSTLDPATLMTPPASAPPAIPAEIALYPMPMALTGYSDVDDSMTPVLTTYFMQWTAAPGPVRYEVREGASNIVYSGPSTNASWAARGVDRNFSVRACYSDGNCSAWLGPLSLYETEL